ncbi:DNA-directed RNA polymerase i subunit rpa34 [Anaeramoeba flamelloides]|uniref:DNA-directed RNA polymerase i subunit rpa34 n=1 Tax=Anaeramoeba flamelloides TaxID=1746091 RepID=A0AAV7YHR1_9EUKA|nr:DNA-directed RNA polymerase i subunit rpa34 [Anaeramoeba flamelloides]
MDSPRTLFKIGLRTKRRRFRFQPNNLRYSKYLCRQNLKKKKKKKKKKQNTEEPNDIKLTKLENSTFTTINSLIKSQLENSTQIKRLIVNKLTSNEQLQEKKTNVFLKFLEIRLKHLQNKKAFLDDDQNNQMGTTSGIGDLESNNNHNRITNNKMNGNDNQKERNKKINYVWDPRFTSSVPLQETLRDVNPGLVLNLYINCFSFFHENLCHSYDYPFKPLFESIINGRINSSLFRTISKNKSHFYNGYLVVDILDYRHRMSNRLAKPDLSSKSNQDQKNQQQDQKNQQQGIGNTDPNRMKIEIKHEPLNRSRANQQNPQQQQHPQQQNLQQPHSQQQKQLQHSIKRLEFEEQTDKKRKVLLSLDEETFSFVVAAMEYQEYSLLRKLETRLSRSGLNPKQQTPQNFGRTQKQLQRLARWGSEKQSRFQQQLLMIKSIPTCFESSIDILKIANYYYSNKYKTNYIRKKLLDSDNKLHHKKEIKNRLLKKILNLNYNLHKKKIVNLDYERINTIKIKLKKKEREKLKKRSNLKKKSKGKKKEKETKTGAGMEMGMGMEMEIEKEKEKEKEKEIVIEKEKESEPGLESDTFDETDTDTDMGTDTDNERNNGREKRKKERDKERKKRKSKRKKYSRFSRRAEMMDMIQPLNTETSGIEFVFKQKKKYKGLTIFRPLLSQRKKLISEQSFSEYIRRLTDPIGGSVNSNLQKFLIKRAKDTNKTIQNEKYTVYYKKKPFMIEQSYNKPSVFTEEQIEKMKQIKEIKMDDIGPRSHDKFSTHHSPLVQIYSSVARPSIFLSVENTNESISNTLQSTTSVSDHTTIPIPNNGKLNNNNNNNNNDNHNFMNVNNTNNTNNANTNNNNQMNKGKNIIGEHNIIDRQIFSYVKPEKNEKAIIKLRVDPESGIHEIDVTFKIGNKGITKTKTTGERVQTKTIFHHYHQFMEKNGWRQENMK